MSLKIGSKILGICLGFILSYSHIAMGDDDDVSPEEGAYGSVRVENEYKLAVPKESVESVWQYLMNRYEGENSFIKKQSPLFAVKISDENFVDRYFDSPDLKMLNSQSGVRHRSRFVDDNTSNHKHGRSLVQLKLKRPQDANELNRSEIKFKVETDLPSPQSAPLIQLVKKKHQQKFINLLAELGVSPMIMDEKLMLKQRRRRVYIEYNGASFATITLDEVSSHKLWHHCQFTEVEIELNEIQYTQASNKERISMQKISNLLKEDLLSTFPMIKQDQTPKYNKAYDALASQGRIYSFFLRYF